MTDKDRHSRAAGRCAKAALRSSTIEIRQFWLAAERGYRFLVDRADRIETEASRAIIICTDC